MKLDDFEEFKKLTQNSVQSPIWQNLDRFNSPATYMAAALFSSVVIVLFFLTNATI